MIPMDLKPFNKRFGELYKEYGMSIVEFAKIVKLSRQTVGHYLNGDRIPDCEVLCQICEKCHVTADWLLGLSDVRSFDQDLRIACNTLNLSEKAANELKSHPDVWNYVLERN